MDKNDIKNWIEDNGTGSEFTTEEINHIAMCMHHIYRWCHEGYPLGGFLTAVVQDKFTEACFKADGINRKALYLYALFLANKIGYDYRKKAMGDDRV